MMKCFLLVVTVLFSFSYLYSQGSVLQGSVTDAQSGHPVAEVFISVSEGKLSAGSDAAGEFQINNILPGKYAVVFSRLGYKSISVDVELLAGQTTFLEVKLISMPLSASEVTVTSTRYETLLKNVSLPMDVMTGKQIEKMQAVSVPDLLQNEPGISLQRDGIWATTVNIRGLSRSAIVTLVDGNRVETATDVSAGLSMVDVNSIKRIEVIKGAASSLYGTGALGGIVNIITNGGEYSDNLGLKGSLQSSYNSVNNARGAAMSLNAGAKAWYLFMNGSIRDASNTKTPLGVLNNSQFSDNSFSAGIGFKPIEDNELKIDFQRFYALDVGLPGGNSLFPSAADVRYPTEERKLFSTEYKMSNLSKSLTHLSLKYYYQFIFRDVENIPHTVTKTPAQNGQPAKQTSVQKITPNARHYTNGLQLQSDWVLWPDHYLVAGIDAFQRNLDSRRERYIQIQTLNSQGDSVTSTTSQVVGERPLPESQFRSIGIYAQDEIQLIKERLKLSIGGRFDQIEIKNSAVSNPVYLIVNGQRNDSPPASTIYWKENNASNYSWSGNLGVLYLLQEGYNLKLTLGRSFRSPSLEERYKYIDQGSIIDLGNPDLKPEEGLFMDAGLQIFKSPVSFSFNLFLNNLNNMVVSKPGIYEGRNALISTNVGKARLYGFDLGGDYAFAADWNIYMNASYVNGRDVEKDQNLPLITPLNGRLGVRIPLPGYASADLSMSAFAAQNNTAAGEFSTPGYAVFNIYLNSVPVFIGETKLSFYAGVENILDKAYRNHLASNRGLITIEPGRNFFFKMNYAW